MSDPGGRADHPGDTDAWQRAMTAALQAQRDFRAENLGNPEWDSDWDDEAEAIVEAAWPHIAAGADHPGDTPADAITAAVQAHAAWYESLGNKYRPELRPLWRQDLAAAMLAAAGPVLVAAAVAEEVRGYESARADFIACLPPCPKCACRTNNDADVRDCACDAGCNDGEWHPGINVIAAGARETERQRIIRFARMCVANFADDPAMAAVSRFADLLEEDTDRD